jgi:hypothetical protein
MLLNRLCLGLPNDVFMPDFLPTKSHICNSILGCMMCDLLWGSLIDKYQRFEKNLLPSLSRQMKILSRNLVTTGWLWSMTGFIGFFATAHDYTLQCTIKHTYTQLCPQSRLHYRCLVAASNGGRSSSSVFSNGPRPQLPGSKSNSSEGLYRSRPLTH